MAKIFLVLVFSLVLALPFPSVLGQDNWKDLLDQGGLNPDSLQEAQKAFGGAAAQAAMHDYFGSALSGASSSPSTSSELEEGEGASLADFLDTDNTNPNAEISAPETGSVVDSSIGAPDVLPDDEDEEEDSSPAGAPAGAPINSSKGASAASPKSAPKNEAKKASRYAPVEAPESESPNARAETPEFDDFEEGERAPTNAPTGEPDDDEEFDDSDPLPTKAPAQAPGGEPLDES